RRTSSRPDAYYPRSGSLARNDLATQRPSSNKRATSSPMAGWLARGSMGYSGVLLHRSGAVIGVLEVAIRAEGSAFISHGHVPGELESQLAGDVAGRASRRSREERSDRLIRT